MKPGSVLPLCAALVAGAVQASAAPAKTLRFWNLTSAPITSLQLAPVGSENFSANLCLGDPDHAVEPDERLNLVGVGGGTYDVRVADGGRRCLFHAVVLNAQGPYAFSITEQQMRACGR